MKEKTQAEKAMDLIVDATPEWKKSQRDKIMDLAVSSGLVLTGEEAGREIRNAFATGLRGGVAPEWVDGVAMPKEQSSHILGEAFASSLRGDDSLEGNLEALKHSSDEIKASKKSESGLFADKLVGWLINQSNNQSLVNLKVADLKLLIKNQNLPSYGKVEFGDRRFVVAGSNISTTEKTINRRLAEKRNGTERD